MLPLLALTPTSRAASVSDLKQGSGLGGGGALPGMQSWGPGPSVPHCWP